jgi:transposase
VRQEFIPWLSNSKRVTQRFAREIGRMCREMSVARVAAMHNLTWGQVRRLEMTYMKELVDKHPPSRQLRAIGIDEASIKKGHRYAIVVADMDQQRPIWMSTTLGRDKEQMDVFFKELGDKQCKKIQIAVMDMWKPFRNSLREHAPRAQIIYDKFHVLGHLNDALDKVRRQEYQRASEKDRKFIKGQRYTLLSKEANLNMKAQESLKLLFKVNKRLNKAYLLKESFGQLWDYGDPIQARKFFDNWKSQLRWSRLKPYKDFVDLIDRHWNGVVSYCHPEHKVSLGFMEGLINKIRVIQRRSFGIQNLEYLKLKIITSFIKDQPL